MHKTGEGPVTSRAAEDVRHRTGEERAGTRSLATGEDGGRRGVLPHARQACGRVRNAGALGREGARAGR